MKKALKLVLLCSLLLGVFGCSKGISEKDITGRWISKTTSAGELQRYIDLFEGGTGETGSWAGSISADGKLQNGSYSIITLTWEIKGNTVNMTFTQGANSHTESFKYEDEKLIKNGSGGFFTGELHK